MRRTMAAAAAVILAGMALGACGGGGTKTIKTPGGDVKVDQNGKGAVTFKDKNGSSTFGAGTSLPSDFPKSDVPLPKNGKVTGYVTGTESGKKSWTVTVSVKDAMKGADAYKSQLQGAGFRSESDSSSGGSSGSFSAYTMIGSKWDVSVMGASDSSSSSGGPNLILSVTTHDKSLDTTTTTASDTSDTSS